MYVDDDALGELTVQILSKTNQTMGEVGTGETAMDKEAKTADEVKKMVEEEEVKKREEMEADEAKKAAEMEIGEAAKAAQIDKKDKNLTGKKESTVKTMAQRIVELKKRKRGGAGTEHNLDANKDDNSNI